MKTWDLTPGTARLDQALRILHKARNQAGESWDDENYRQFHEKYLAPLELRVKRALDVSRHLAHVLGEARRECESD